MNNTFEKFMKTLNENVRITGNILNENLTYGGPKARYDIAISVDSDQRTDRGMMNNPYFKVYNNKDPYGKKKDNNKKKSATKVARIYFDKAEYEKEHKGVNTFKLNSSQKKDLLAVLSSPAPGYDNYWEKLKHDAISKYNGSIQLSDEFKEYFLTLPLPDIDNLE